MIAILPLRSLSVDLSSQSSESLSESAFRWLRDNVNEGIIPSIANASKAITQRKHRVIIFLIIVHHDILQLPFERAAGYINH